MGKTRASSRGQRQGTGLSVRDRTALKRGAEASIDAFLKSEGYAGPSQQTGADGCRYFQRGSASGIAYVVQTDDDVIFHTAAKVMDLPGDRDLILPLFRELLELNLVLQGGTRLGISDNQVLAAMTESVRLIDDDNYGIYINRVMAFADAVDDKLQEKYGGTTQKRPTK